MWAKYGLNENRKFLEEAQVKEKGDKIEKSREGWRKERKTTQK